MSPDPEPLDAAPYIVAQRAMMLANSHGPDLSYALEVQRWMLWIGLEKLEILVRNVSHRLGQRLVKHPKARRRGVIQRGRVFCAL